MIVVQNGTFPSPGIAPTLSPMQRINSIGRAVWVEAVLVGSQALVVRRGCCWTARSLACPEASEDKEKDKYVLTQQCICKDYKSIFYRTLFNHQNLIRHENIKPKPKNQVQGASTITQTLCSLFHTLRQKRADGPHKHLFSQSSIMET